MNKIIIESDKNLILNEELYEIEIIKDCNLNILINNKDVKIILLIKNSLVNINLVVNKDNNLIINSLGIDSSINYNVDINENSNILVIDSIFSNIDSINNIKLNHKGNNSIVKFYTNGININNKKMYFYLDGIVPKNSCGIYLEENSKIINISDGDSKIIPNLIIDTKEVSANHSAFIGTLSNNDLSYLMSRGIDKEIASKLLIKSILLSKMELNTDKFIEEIERGII